MIDLGLVHRNDYYTGILVRGYIENMGEAVLSGGRYDTLLANFGAPLEAIGFGVNVDLLTRHVLSAAHSPRVRADLLVAAAAPQTAAGVALGGTAGGCGTCSGERSTSRSGRGSPVCGRARHWTR